MTDDGSGVISNWKDRIGGLAIAATTTARPTWGQNSFNSGHPGLTFDGVANCFASTTLTGLPTGSSPGEIWAVCESVSVASLTEIANYGSSGASSGRGIRHTAADLTAITDNTATNSGAASIAAGGGHIISGDFSGTAMNGYTDGTAHSSNPVTIATLNTSATRLRVAAFLATSAAGFWQGTVSDFLVLAGVLSMKDRQSLQGYLAWNRGLVSVLPVTHPYRGRRP